MVKDRDAPSTLGERIRKSRKTQGLTAKVLARAIDVSTSYISKLECGQQKDPSLPVLLRLADALAIDLHVLMGAEQGGEGFQG